MALRVDVSQNRYEEGGRLPLGDQLPAAGLTELRGERVTADPGSEGSRDMGWGWDGWRESECIPARTY